MPNITLETLVELHDGWGERDIVNRIGEPLTLKAFWEDNPDMTYGEIGDLKRWLRIYGTMRMGGGAVPKTSLHLADPDAAEPALSTTPLPTDEREAQLVQALELATAALGLIDTEAGQMDGHAKSPVLISFEYIISARAVLSEAKAVLAGEATTPTPRAQRDELLAVLERSESRMMEAEQTLRDLGNSKTAALMSKGASEARAAISSRISSLESSWVALSEAWTR